MTLAYVRRQHYLHRSQAVHVINAYAEALGAGQPAAGTASSPSAKPQPSGAGRKVSGNVLLDMMASRVVKES